MRAKLLLLMCVASLPNFLPAQLVEEVLIDSVPFNHPDPQKRLAGEITAAQEALARKESSAGAQSPETADAVSALADLYLKAGDYERASPLIERALKIRRTSLGDENWDTAASLHQLAVSGGTGRVCRGRSIVSQRPPRSGAGRLAQRRDRRDPPRLGPSAIQDG